MEGDMIKLLIKKLKLMYIPCIQSKNLELVLNPTTSAKQIHKLNLQNCTMLVIWFSKYITEAHSQFAVATESVVPYTTTQ